MTSYHLACPDAETLELLFDGKLASDGCSAIADHASSCRDCHDLIELLFDSVAEIAGLRAGARIDRYVIERRIGQGGMGVVYAARDPELGRTIAIKVLRAGIPAERLRREAQSLGRLSHPNVVAVHDVGDHDGQTFIAMALVDGASLRRWIEQPRSADEIMAVLRAAGRGIAHAHAAGMIHRDLKPDNIFVAHDGAVLVGDFGLARGPEAEPAGMVIGTPAYMAPEQAKGEATIASDQFSFCVMAWEALFGDRPFRAPTFALLQTEIARGVIADPPAGVGSKIVRALRRGLAADPAQRFATMNDLLAELAPRRRRWPWIAGAAAITAVIAITPAVAILPRAPSCATEHLLDATWGPNQHATLPAAPIVVKELDRYADRWLALRDEVCVAQPARGAEITRCLEARRLALHSVVEALATKTEPMVALRAIDGLPSVEECAIADAAPNPTAAALVTSAALISRLATLRAEYVLERPPSLDQVRALERDADDATLIGALGLEADLLTDGGLTDEAERLLRRAMLVAERTRDDIGRVQTSVELVHVLVRLQRVAEAHNVVDTATAMFARIKIPLELDRELVKARAEIIAAQGDHRDAAELLQRYVAACESARDPSELVLGYVALGGELASSGQSDEAAVVFGKLAVAERAIGGDALATPNALQTEAIAAQTAGRFEHAIELSERALAMIRSQPHSPSEEANGLYGAASSYTFAGAWVKLHEASEAQLALLPHTELLRPTRAEALENAGIGYLYAGVPVRAVDSLRASIALDRQIGADTTNATIALGSALFRVGKLHDARLLMETIVPALVVAQPPRPWRRATASFTLARTLWEEGDDHDRGRARALASDAETAFVDGIDQLSAFPAAATSVRILTGRLAELRAWRLRHP